MYSSSLDHFHCKNLTPLAFSISYISHLLTNTSSPRNIVYIGIFFTVQMAFTLVAASYFAAADGHPSGSEALKKAGGVFAFLSGLLGYYTVGNLMCQDALQFSFPMGDTSHYFIKQEDRD